jgi:type IV secretory pathway VirB4 component
MQDKLHESFVEKKSLENQFKYAGTVGDIDFINPLFYPTTSFSSSSFFGGQIKSSNSPFYFEMDLKPEVSNHSLVIGSTGMGKSAFVKSIIWQLNQKGIKTIILDPMNEYKQITDAIGGEELDLTNNNGIDIFKISKDDSVMDLSLIFYDLMEAITNSTLTEVQKQGINNALHNAKNDAANTNFLQRFIDEISKDEKLKTLASSLGNEKIVKLLTGGGSKQLVNKQQQNSLCTRISFSGLSGKELVLFVSITSQIITKLMSNIKIPTVIILDEAFKFMNSKGNSDKIVSWLRQMRKMNTSIILIDQSIRDYGQVAKTIWENTTHHFMFSHGYTEQITLDKQLYTKITNQTPYQFYYHYKGLYDRGVFVKSVIADNLVGVV